MTKERLSEEPLSEEDADKFLGGRALGAKILFEELSSGIDPLGPENKLIFATGVTTGVPFSGNCRYVVMAKSPLTGGWGESNASGFFGPELKFSGFDLIIFEGKASHPVYLVVERGKPQLQDARALWGKMTGETQDQIRAQRRRQDQSGVHRPRGREPCTIRLDPQRSSSSIGTNRHGGCYGL